MGLLVTGIHIIIVEREEIEPIYNNTH